MKHPPHAVGINREHAAASGIDLDGKIAPRLEASTANPIWRLRSWRLSVKSRAMAAKMRTVAPILLAACLLLGVPHAATAADKIKIENR